MYKLFRRVLPYISASSILFASNAYAKDTENPVGNFLAGVFSAPFKIVHHTIDGFIDGNKDLPVIGAVSGAFRGLGYGVIDSAENVVKGSAGKEISKPEDLGDVSSELDKSAIGRFAVGALTAAGVGAVVANNESIVINHSKPYSAEKGALLFGGTTATTSGLEEAVKELEQ